MRTILLCAALAAFYACSKPDPYNQVRKARRDYKMKLDFTVHSENDEVTFQLEVQNLSSNSLQELTVIVEALDGEQKPFWQDQRELDVLGLKEFQTKTISSKETIEGASQKLEYFNVRLAPDDPNSDFESYKEFLRVAP